MALISALILTRFRETAEKAAAWLTKERYQALFLDLPEDFTMFVREYMDKGMPQERLWGSYGYLTGLQEPFINALRFQMDPVFNVLPGLRRLMPMLKVYCYQDLECQIEANRLSERLLLLATRERVRRKIRLEEWRRLLADELELAALGLGRIVDNVVEGAGMHWRDVVLYGGLVKPFKDCMEAKGFKVKPIYLQRYWQNPLDVLRIVSWAHGVNNVPDEVIMRCVRTYLSYLDYVLSSEDLDAAHAKWTSEIQPDVPQNAKPNISP
jgi:hypothetical protein